MIIHIFQQLKKTHFCTPDIYIYKKVEANLSHCFINNNKYLNIHNDTTFYLK